MVVGFCGFFPECNVFARERLILSTGENFRCWTVTCAEAIVTYRLTISSVRCPKIY